MTSGPAADRVAVFFDYQNFYRSTRERFSLSKSLANQRPQEKGIDVALALDFVLEALEGAYDVGILVSLDTDLRPALERVASRSPARAEVAAWSGERGHARRLALPGRRLWCHWLGPADYRAVADRTDYGRA